MDATAVSATRRAGRRTSQAWSIIRRVAIYALMVAIASITIGPFVMMVSTALRPNLIYLAFPIPIVPPDAGLDNFAALFGRTGVARWILNSVILTAGVTTLQIVTCSMAGFAFARGEFPGRDILFWTFMATLMIPSTATLVPLFLVIANLGWANTYQGLIIPQATSIFGTFLMRQYFKTIPKDYDDAALMDGANRWQIYYRVILPLALPAAATLGTLTFLGVWNDFLFPLVVTSTDEMRPLTVGLATLITRTGNAGFVMAGATTSFVPTFLFFMYMQRWVVQGISLSGIKG